MVCCVVGGGTLVFDGRAVRSTGRHEDRQQGGDRNLASRVVSDFGAIHLSRLDWRGADRSPTRWGALSAVAGRVPVVVRHGRGVPGLPGVAALAGRVRLPALWERRWLACRGRQRQVRRMQGPDRVHRLSFGYPFAHPIRTDSEPLCEITSRGTSTFHLMRVRRAPRAALTGHSGDDAPVGAAWVTPRALRSLPRSMSLRRS